MIESALDDETLRRLTLEIEHTPPRPHHAALLATLGRLLPRREFRHALSRGGWHRPGGVVRADGERLDDDLLSWLETEMADCDEDFELFLDRHADAGLIATRHEGHSHYFVLALGPDPAAFQQLEIEELRETLCRLLIDPERPPEDPAELLDPLAPLSVTPQAVGRPRYRFRRLVDMRQIVARQPARIGDQAPLSRFLDDWRASSAGTRGHFCDHWIIALREHQDRYRNLQISATPVSRHARELRHFPWRADARGVALSEQLHAFDRAAGYPASWYFHLVAGALTPRDIAFAAGHDLDDGFRYLPDAERKLLEAWLRAPYSI
jgi:hypothetical protein